MNRKKLAFSVLVTFLLFVEAAIFLPHIAHPLAVIAAYTVPIAGGVVVYKADIG